MGITLLLTQPNDATSDYIQAAFKRKKQLISRINLGVSNVPNLSIMPLRNGYGLIEDSDGNKIKVNDVNAIIIRRPAIPELHTNDVKNRFLSREVIHGLRAFLESASAIWMNHPEKNSIASSKPRNLWLASKYGLKVPQTLISSEPAEISKWLESHKKCVIKSISYGLMEGENTAEMAFTQRVPRKFNVDEDLTKGVPILLQDEIQKTADIRVTVVGKRAFSAILPTNGNEIDWRESSVSKWEPFSLPEKIEYRCIQMCKELGLEFAAIDLVKNSSGEYFFLELNPNGQWVWIEQDTKLPISDAFVEHLSGVSNG